MKVAFIAVTRGGTELAARIARDFSAADVFVREGYQSEALQQTFVSLKDLVQDSWGKYLGFVMVMATGIAVRVIAPCLADKRTDPAVVVVDEAGRFVISLVSGHLGGANDLARQVAACIGATPVVTTATDVLGKSAVDVMAKKLALTIEPFAALKTINAAIVHGKDVRVFIDAETDTFALAKSCPDLMAGDLTVGILREGTAPDGGDAHVYITSRILPAGDKPFVYLRPRHLTVGVGCRRGTTPEAIYRAVTAACVRIGRSPSAIRCLASVTAKKDEPGLLAAGERLGVPVWFFSPEQLTAVIEREQLATSAFVGEKIGVGGVCEPAALLAGKHTRLLLPKTKYNGIAVAIAAAGFPSSASDPGRPNT